MHRPHLNWNASAQALEGKPSQKPPRPQQQQQQPQKGEMDNNKTETSYLLRLPRTILLVLFSSPFGFAFFEFVLREQTALGG
ncbi:hypothetical protein PABG_12285 [Paracoccidioides brasiliensis Pb03]|nr:hypothetical protein PABG_12285 [Paracoccidioides brasiliensis Pb03]